MVKKTLNDRTDLFNTAIIDKYFENGACICTLQQVEIQKDSQGEPILDEDGKQIEVIVKQDSNIGFESGYFSFTDEELDELNPKVETITPLFDTP